MLGRLLGKIQVGTSINESIDNRVKETCAIMSTEITRETDHIYLLVIQQYQVQ